MSLPKLDNTFSQMSRKSLLRRGSSTRTEGHLQLVRIAKARLSHLSAGFNGRVSPLDALPVKYLVWNA